jgi:hypothetical protein
MDTRIGAVTLSAFAILAALAGAGVGARGVWLLVRALRDADDPRASLTLIRGIRGIVVAVAAGALAAGVLSSQTWLLVFGTIFLAEELYETGVVALVLRADLRQLRMTSGSPTGPMGGAHRPGEIRRACWSGGPGPRYLEGARERHRP